MILVYTSSAGSRYDYTFDLIFKELLGVEYGFSFIEKEFLAYEGPKINYSNIHFEDVIQIFNKGLLNSTGLDYPEVELSEWHGLPVFYSSDKRGEIPFDIFSLTFLLASRMEEYQAEETDVHGRFPAEGSIAFKYGFHKRPLINLLVKEFGKILVEKFDRLNIKQHTFMHIPSFDIDTAFDYKAKGLFRTLGGMCKDAITLRFDRYYERCLVLFGLKEDPYDQFDFMIKVVKDAHLISLFFVNMGDYGAHDKQNKLKSSSFKKLLIKLDRSLGVHIHPSYQSNLKPGLVEIEKNKLEEVIGHKVFKSRQHYLKLTFPNTFQRLIDIGVTSDYSLGYASQIGFRSSMCTPFNFYDLQNEKATDLIFYPFCYMDGTFTDYLKLEQDEILNELEPMLNDVKTCGGLFIGIWHNSFINTDKAIKKLFLDIINLCK